MIGCRVGELLQQRGVRQAQHPTQQGVLDEMARLEHRVRAKFGKTGEEIEVLSVVTQRGACPGAIASLRGLGVPELGEQGPSYGAEDVRGHASLRRHGPDLQPELAGRQRVDVRREVPQAVGQARHARQQQPRQNHCRLGVVLSQLGQTGEQIVLGRGRNATRPVG